MSRALKKAVEAAAKQKKDGGEVNVPDEGIANLEDVPELFSLNNITRLVLSHNKISILPPEIVELRNLEYLNLFNNHLEDLPTTISALPRLKELNIALNRLCELPRGFGSFPALEILDLTYNNLTNTSFSANFSYLGECLRALYMGDNDLTEFPPQIEKFVHLEILVLRDNEISEVPKTIHRCAKLKTLHLQVNQINVLPPELTRLDFLGEKCTFYVYDNPLIHALDEKLQTAQTSIVKLLFEYMRTEEYREIYARFKEEGKDSKVKRDRSGKRCRKVTRHRLLVDSK